MKVFLFYYKDEEIPYILEERPPEDKIFLFRGKNYNLLAKSYSKIQNKLKLWWTIVKIIKFMHNVDISMMDVNLLYPYTNLNQLIYPKTPLIWRLGGDIFVEHATRTGLPLFNNEKYEAGGKLFLFLSRRMLESCSAIVVHSNWLKTELRKEISNRNIYVIYQNVDSKLFNPQIDNTSFRKSFGITGNQIVLLSVMQGSYLQKVKGLLYYFKAVKHLTEKYGKNLVVLICGSGRYYSYLQNYTNKLGLTNIHFLGFQPEINKIYAACDIFIHPSLLDVAPRVIREAGISAKPIVAFKTGGVPELIDSNHSFLIEPYNQETLYSILENLIENRALREEYGKKAYNFINNKNKISSGKLFWKIFDKFRQD